MLIENRIKRCLVRFIRLVRVYKFTLLVFLPIFLLLLFYFLIPLLITHGSWGLHYTDKTGWMGDTIGGIVGPMVGFVGVILTFMAFYAQYRANQIQLSVINEQRNAANKNERQILVQQIENNFFELLKLHRENVREITFRGESGRDVFVTMINQFRDIYLIVNQTNEIQDLSVHDKTNIAYLLFFFGVSDDVLQTLQNRFINHYDGFIWDKINTRIISRRMKTEEDVQLYNGHQSRLGHYYRHLNRTVNFIHKDTLLTPNEKLKYITLLRTQLSTHEQILFFFNSLSDLGLTWEKDPRVSAEDKLITKYDLIRNIPMGGTFGINPRLFYPNVNYDHPYEVTIVDEKTN